MTKLRLFQSEDVRQIYRWKGRALVGSEMGTGKTIIALDWIHKTPGHRPAIIVCPSTVKYAWQAEAAGFGIRAEVIEGRKSEKDLPGDIWILNYEILSDWLECLIEHSPSVLVLDEVHRLRNPSAQCTKAARALGRVARSVLGLSGTPIPNELIELWSPLSIIRPDLFPERMKFGWRYTRPVSIYGRWVFKGARRTEELKSILLGKCMIRRLKKDVAPELPDKIRKVVPFRLASYKEYHHALRGFLAWLEKENPGRVAKAKKNAALVQVGYLMRLISKLKMKWVIQWLEEWSELHPGEKMVCLTMHTEVINVLSDRFKNSVIIDGRVSGILRQESIRKFNSNPKVRFLFGNWKAAGVGANLQIACHATAIDLPWTPGDLLQGEDRIHRIGQTRTCLIHYLIAMDTIEEKYLKAIQARGEIHDEVLDDRNGKSLNIYDMLTQITKEGLL